MLARLDKTSATVDAARFGWSHGARFGCYGMGGQIKSGRRAKAILNMSRKTQSMQKTREKFYIRFMICGSWVSHGV